MAFSRPSILPSIDINQANRTAPPVGKQNNGYVLNDILAAAEYNWAAGFSADWLRWIQERSENGTTASRDFTLTAVDSVAASGIPGGILTLTGGNGDGAGVGGNVFLTGGFGGTTSAGGEIP